MINQKLDVSIKFFRLSVRISFMKTCKSSRGALSVSIISTGVCNLGTNVLAFSPQLVPLLYNWFVGWSCQVSHNYDRMGFLSMKFLLNKSRNMICIIENSGENISTVYNVRLAWLYLVFISVDATCIENMYGMSN